MIKRPVYLDELISFKDKDLIKVVTGIRRCGKSTLLDLYAEYLLNNGTNSNQIIRIKTIIKSLNQRFSDFFVLIIIS